MKKLVRLIRRQYYLRLYRRLFWSYTKQGMNAQDATWNAGEAFAYLAAFDYDELFKGYPKPDV